MRVLLASPLGMVSGGIARWTRHILDYYSHNKSSDFELLFFDTSRKVQTSKRLFVRIFQALADYPSIIFSFRRYINKNKIDVVHITSSASLGLIKDIILLNISKKKGIKVIIHFRFGRTPELKEKNNWEWKLLCKVISISNLSLFLDKRSYDALYASGFRNIRILPNPISPTIFSLIEKYGSIERNECVVLFVGHCTRKKGVYELIEACSQIPTIELRLVGSIMDDMKNDIPNIEKLNPNISFSGEEAYEEIIQEMLHCGLFVLPSYTEGFPNVVLEAMACGCAIIGTDVGAIPEMLSYGDKLYGEIIPPMDTTSLNKAISKLISDTCLKDSYRSKVVSIVKDKYSMEAIWNELLKIWRDLL